MQNVLFDWPGVWLLLGLAAMVILAAMVGTWRIPVPGAGVPLLAATTHARAASGTSRPRAARRRQTGPATEPAPTSRTSSAAEPAPPANTRPASVRGRARRRAAEATPVNPVTGTQRLAGGALRDLVRDHLAQHAGQPLTPSRVAKALGRSAGAVGNAMDSLTKAGVIQQTSDKPRAYTYPKGRTRGTRAATAPATPRKPEAAAPAPTPPRTRRTRGAKQQEPEELEAVRAEITAFGLEHWRLLDVKQPHGDVKVRHHHGAALHHTEQGDLPAARRALASARRRVEFVTTHPDRRQLGPRARAKLAAETRAQTTPPAKDTPAAADATPKTPVTPPQRLPGGSLRTLVFDYLVEHAGQELTPGRVAKALGRSAGAVGNAMDRLTSGGAIHLSSEKPRAYTYHAPNTDTSAQDAPAPSRRARGKQQPEEGLDAVKAEIAAFRNEHGTLIDLTGPDGDVQVNRHYSNAHDHAQEGDAKAARRALASARRRVTSLTNHPERHTRSRRGRAIQQTIPAAEAETAPPEDATPAATPEPAPARRRRRTPTQADAAPARASKGRGTTRPATPPPINQKEERTPTAPATEPSAPAPATRRRTTSTPAPKRPVSPAAIQATTKELADFRRAHEALLDAANPAYDKEADTNYLRAFTALARNDHATATEALAAALERAAALQPPATPAATTSPASGRSRRKRTPAAKGKDTAAAS